MNDLFKTLADQLKGAGAGSKAIAALVAAAILTAIGITAVVANRPDFQPAFLNINADEKVKVCAALAEAGIDFRASQSQFEHAVSVSTSDLHRAMAAVYGSDALRKPLRGIQTEAGAGKLWLGTAEREAIVGKALREDVELMLETFDYVRRASVMFQMGDPSALGRTRIAPSASVSVTMASPEAPAAAGANMANLVSRALGIEKEHIVILDQDSTTLFDGSEENGGALDRSLRDVAAHKERWEKKKTEDVNALLEDTLGPRKARVIIESTWELRQSVTRVNTPTEGSLLFQSTSNTKTPVTNDSAGGAAGFSANIPSPTDPTAPTGGSGGGKPADPPLAETEDSETRYAPGTQVKDEVQDKFELTDLSVALYVDESVPNPDSIRDLVAQAVNYDVERFGEFVPVVGSIYTPEVVEGAEGADAPPSGAMVMLEQYAPRGVEIAVALVFVFLLLKSLKGAKATVTARTASRTSAAGGGNAGDEIDPELLARAQVEELLRADPDRVGEILSAWARNEAGVVGAKS